MCLFPSRTSPSGPELHHNPSIRLMPAHAQLTIFQLMAFHSHWALIPSLSSERKAVSFQLDICHILFSLLIAVKTVLLYKYLIVSVPVRGIQWELYCAAEEELTTIEYFKDYYMLKNMVATTCLWDSHRWRWLFGQCPCENSSDTHE